VHEQVSGHARLIAARTYAAGVTSVREPAGRRWPRGAICDL